MRPDNQEKKKDLVNMITHDIVILFPGLPIIHFFDGKKKTEAFKY